MLGNTMVFCFLLVLVLPVGAQDSTRLVLSLYGEVYYSYDFSRPKSHARPPFLYSYNRAEEVNVNLGLIKASFTGAKARANLGFMAGTYSNANLSAEPGVLKNLYEANAGVRVSKKHQLWIDAGVLPSHIGLESAIGKDCWTLSRSLAAENSPYYEAGVRFSYNSTSKKWYTALLLLNGWQRIQRKEGNSTPAAGTQVTYKPNAKVTINSSTFVGNDQPDSARRMRYFHNLYSIVHLNDKTRFALGLDAGLEQKQKGSSTMYSWYTPLAMVHHAIGQNKYIALRGEYYQDKQGVIISNINGAPVSLWGYSSNFDWHITQNLLWRVEARGLYSKHPVFLQHNGNYTQSNVAATTAFCFSF